MTETNALPEFFNEDMRVAAVHALGDRRGHDVRALDVLCQAAADMFGVPVALTSLLGRDNQQYVGRFGLSRDEIAGELCFCRHAILADDVFVVTDARTHPVFHDDALVSGLPKICFYAGAPLILEPGIRVGTLCLIDQGPREFSKTDRLRLTRLAALATEILRMSRQGGDFQPETRPHIAEEQPHSVSHSALVSLKNRLTHWTRLSSDWIWETDAEHRFIFVEGDGASHHLDFQSWLGKRRWEIAADGQMEFWQGYQQQVDRRQPIRSFCFALTRNDGAIMVAEVTGDPVFDPGGAFVGYRGVTRDVTAREGMLRRLKIAELIAEETRHAIVLTDDKGCITWINPAFSVITGYTLDEVRGRTPGSVLQCEETSSQTVADIRAALESGEGIRTEILNEAKDGRRYWLDLEIRSVKTSAGAIEGFIAMESDITAWVDENNRKTAIFENATAGLVIHDENGASLDCNQEALAILGVTMEQLLGRKAMDPEWRLLAQDGRPLDGDSIPARRALLENQPVRNQIVGVRHGDGRLRWLRANAQAFQVRTNQRQVVVAFADVTHEENARREAESTRELLSTVIETIPDAIAAFDKDDRLLLFNSAYTRFYGTSAPAIKVGAAFSDILEFGLAAGQYLDAGNSEAEKQAWLENRLRLHQENQPKSMIQQLDNGRWLQVRERHSPSGVTVGVRTDITAIKRAEEQLRSASEMDYLTGLPNRSAFITRFQKAVDGRPGARVVVALLDLDHFKDLNDTLGHHLGDEFLRQISQRLVSRLRPGDVVARLGGDEFGLLLFGMSGKTEAQARMTQFSREVSQPLLLGEKLVEAQMSVGVSLYPEDGTEVGELLKNADISMYETKKSGRNGVTVFNRSHRELFSRRAYVAERLREAVRAERLDVAFQAQVDLQTGQHTGFEALARWDDFDTSISPEEFIPIADEFGLSSEIDMQVMVKSLSRLRLLKDMGHQPERIAINLGTLTLRDPNLPDRVKNLLYECRLEPEDLEVEVTENVMIGRGHEKVKSNLLSLRNSGISVALDDFGTGYASLTHLKAFRVDKIKIDRSFVKEITTNESDGIIVKALVSLAAALGIKVVGEGIETEAQRQLLCLYGCDDGQGYMFHRPERNLMKLDQYLTEKMA